MSSTQKIIAVLGFLVLLVGLGMSDAMLTGSFMTLPEVTYTETTESSPQTGSGAQTSGTGNVIGQKPHPGVMRQTGPDVLTVLSDLQIATQSSAQKSLLSRVVPEGITVNSRVLLRDNDRVALFSWIESSKAKPLYLALKEALHEQFTAKLDNLVDEQQTPEHHPVRDILTFIDTGIDEERLLFVRVRDRLYEFHIAEGKDVDVQELVDALTK